MEKILETRDGTILWEENGKYYSSNPRSVLKEIKLELNPKFPICAMLAKFLDSEIKQSGGIRILKKVYTFTSEDDKNVEVYICSSSYARAFSLITKYFKRNGLGNPVLSSKIH